MYEKVSALHIDKVADRISGAMIDLAYEKSIGSPKVAIEILIGHKHCHVIAESSYEFTYDEVKQIVDRIAGSQFELDLQVVPQDKYLALNQSGVIKTGDNGIFRGVKISEEERILSQFAKHIYNKKLQTDGKYLISGDTITICQSGISNDEMLNIACEYFKDYDYKFIINPLGAWLADLDNDTGVTGRKIGSDLGRGATGGNINGKDLSKSDVSVNIFLYLLLNKRNTITSICPFSNYTDLLDTLLDKTKNLNEVECTCSIGDENINICGVVVPFWLIVAIVDKYITICVGGFEKLAEWGLV